MKTTETDLFCTRDKHYSPKTGRFISEDPIGFAGGNTNLYGYVNNRPTMLKDPSGKNPLEEFITRNICRLNDRCCETNFSDAVGCLFSFDDDDSGDSDDDSPRSCSEL